MLVSTLSPAAGNCHSRKRSLANKPQTWRMLNKILSGADRICILILGVPQQTEPESYSSSQSTLPCSINYSNTSYLEITLVFCETCMCRCDKGHWPKLNYKNCVSAFPPRSIDSIFLLFNRSSEQSKLYYLSQKKIRGTVNKSPSS